ncbi:uncharacterized protein LOC119639101 [Glossina fuscipes]|uniref:Uncharacterized protein LOC119639101 n=1 Tax=Glossina fuscipes TaxID=7396 RepID=A0A9C5Z3X3_9MUSC|nr:uncharacterized protein LOC119639101 [Glossina fuscipes]
MVCCILASILFASTANVPLNETHYQLQYYKIYNKRSALNLTFSQPQGLVTRQRQRQRQRQQQDIKYKRVDKLSNREIKDQFDYRYPDGSYEYRYELDNGSARYERGYFLQIDDQKILVVVGYYSYRMPNGQYITAFYNADQNGYRQTQAITREAYPNLPRTLNVPEP